jgi:hypothetical protein
MLDPVIVLLRTDQLGKVRLGLGLGLVLVLELL